MTAASPHPGHRLVGVIAPGDGPHLFAPTVAAYRSRLTGPRVSLAGELAVCLAILAEDPEHYRRAAASWHARWCVELTTLTRAETHTAKTLLQAIACPRGTDAARTLRYLCLLHDERAVATVLQRWIEEQERD